MNQSEFSELITKKIGNLFTYSPSNQYIRIRTPFIYPDGDVIDLFYKEDGEYVILSDLGETLGWLRMQTTDQQKSSKSLFEKVREQRDAGPSNGSWRCNSWLRYSQE